MLSFQNFNSWNEIIAEDSGSTSAIMRLVKAFQVRIDKEIKLIETRLNGGGIENEKV
jgi:hypothetical protein